MSCSIFILRRAQRELAQLPNEVYERVCDAIRALADDKAASQFSSGQAVQDGGDGLEIIV